MLPQRTAAFLYVTPYILVNVMCFREPVNFIFKARDLFSTDRSNIVGILEYHLVKEYGGVEVSSMCY